MQDEDPLLIDSKDNKFGGSIEVTSKQIKSDYLTKDEYKLEESVSYFILLYIFLFVCKILTTLLLK